MIHSTETGTIPLDHKKTVKNQLIDGKGLSYNSEDYDLPWHRVINKDGFISIKSFDHPKGLQKALLEQEGIEVSSDFVINLDKYGWFG